MPSFEWQGDVRPLKSPGNKDTIFPDLYGKTSFISPKSNLGLVFLKNSQPKMTEANNSVADKKGHV